MSLSIFKANMVLYMRNKRPITQRSFANKLAIEYDAAVKRGFQSQLTTVRVLRGNIQLLENLLYSVLQRNLYNTETTYTIRDFGPAFLSYWAGATFSTFPIPPIPATGAISNVTLNQVIVTNPGTWNWNTPDLPVKSPSVFINFLCSAILLHLSTIQGLYIVTSNYPGPISPILGPGIVPWQTYFIQPPTTNSLVSLNPIFIQNFNLEPYVDVLGDGVEKPKTLSDLIELDNALDDFNINQAETLIDELDIDGTLQIETDTNTDILDIDGNIKKTGYKRLCNPKIFISFLDTDS